MPSSYYNSHAEELIKLAETFENSPLEHVRIRAKRIRALIKNEKERND